jgi:flagellin-like hook-associated protein FlgL
MRIATSTIYSQQATSIDNLETQYQNQGQDLSTGKSLNAPSDDPTQIGLDLNIRTTLKVENQQTINAQAGTAQLTSADSALANLTSVLQSARELATRGASDLLSPSERKDIGGQVDQYLQQAVAIANTQYAGTYVFGGSVQSSTAPVTTAGSPISSVGFTGNEQSQAPLLFNGQSFSLSPTLQQAFNYDATNGSPSVFQTLITLRNSLDNGTVTDQSAQAVNQAGQVIFGAGSPAALQTKLGTAGISPFAVVPTPDAGVPPGYSISINNTDAAGNAHVQAYRFFPATAVDDSPSLSPNSATPASIVGAINANTATTGLSATFDTTTQRMSLSSTGGGAFTVTDEPPAGGTTTATSNFTTAFGLTGSATLPQTISTQLGDIDNALDVTLNARSLVGSRVNALAQISTQVSTDVLDNTSVQSGIEDTDIATTTTAFSATQAALTASYSTTTRLEAKDLFDYL